jgi:hypothetical protein
MKQLASVYSTKIIQVIQFVREAHERFLEADEDAKLMCSPGWGLAPTCITMCKQLIAKLLVDKKKVQMALRNERAVSENNNNKRSPSPAKSRSVSPSPADSAKGPRPKFSGGMLGPRAKAKFSGGMLGPRGKAGPKAKAKFGPKAGVSVFAKGAGGGGSPTTAAVASAVSLIPANEAGASPDDADAILFVNSTQALFSSIQQSMEHKRMAVHFELWRGFKGRRARGRAKKQKRAGSDWDQTADDKLGVGSPGLLSQLVHFPRIITTDEGLNPRIARARDVRSLLKGVILNKWRDAVFGETDQKLRGLKVESVTKS